MKKVLCLLFCLSIFTLVQAQTEKGRWLVGTQLGKLSYSDQDDQRYFTGSILPSSGYFVEDGLVLGLGIPVDLSIGLYSTYVLGVAGKVQQNTKSVSYGLSPFIRYYIGSSKLKPYLGLSYGYSQQRSITKIKDETAQELKGYSSTISPSVGIGYFLNRDVAINANLSYDVERREGKRSYPNLANTEYTDSFKSISLGLGIQLFFGK